MPDFTTIIPAALLGCEVKEVPRSGQNSRPACRPDRRDPAKFVGYCFSQKGQTLCFPGHLHVLQKQLSPREKEDASWCDKFTAFYHPSISAIQVMIFIVERAKEGYQSEQGDSKEHNSLPCFHILLGILMPPSSRSTTPLSMIFSMVCVTNCANSCGCPGLTNYLLSAATKFSVERDIPTWEFHDSGQARPNLVRHH